MSCNHPKTQGRKNQKGLWCADCKIKIYDVESKPCGECQHFKRELGSNVIGYCRPKLMTVTSSLNVTYRVSDGTCFLQKIN